MSAPAKKIDSIQEVYADMIDVLEQIRTANTSLTLPPVFPPWALAYVVSNDIGADVIQQLGEVLQRWAQALKNAKTNA
jgi:hypothetical protein